MRTLKILVVDDHAIYRKGLLMAFRESHFAQALFFEAGTGLQAISQSIEHRPDIIFMDISMPELNGFDASKRILKLFPDTKIIALTTFDEIPLIINLFRIGVRAFLSKAIEVYQLEECIRAVLMGDYYYHSRYDEVIARWLREDITKEIPTIEFTAREMQLILLIAKGKTSREIAEQLNISTRSVDSYRKDMIEKVGVTNSSQLVSYVLRNGVLN